MKKRGIMIAFFISFCYNDFNKENTASCRVLGGLREKLVFHAGFVAFVVFDNDFATQNLPQLPKKGRLS